MTMKNHKEIYRRYTEAINLLISGGLVPVAKEPADIVCNSDNQAQPLTRATPGELEDILCYLAREAYIDNALKEEVGYLQLLSLRTDAKKWYQTFIVRKKGWRLCNITVTATLHVDQPTSITADEDFTFTSRLTLPVNCPHEAEELIKDYFHFKTPIDCLDDFEFDYSWEDPSAAVEAIDLRNYSSTTPKETE